MSGAIISARSWSPVRLSVSSWAMMASILSRSLDFAQTCPTSRRLASSSVLNTPESTVSRLPAALPPPVVSSGQKARYGQPYFRCSDPVGGDAELHHPVLDMVIQQFGIPLGEIPGVLCRIAPHRSLRRRHANHRGLAKEFADALERIRHSDTISARGELEDALVVRSRHTWEGEPSWGGRSAGGRAGPLGAACWPGTWAEGAGRSGHDLLCLR